ncbi:unnamed protein product [Mesocestoides corti]|uniref:ABC transporter domain-containing protein n=1 Tax=Mesocestoides corti TaxID=53468 RepID=A0A0R3UC40_MESCO|nr:unnamed protein product [Mesocestoides corti]
MSTKGITQDLTQNTTHNESKPQTACSVLNSIFRFDTARPWTSRLRAAMQSEVYFFPNTTMTKEIVEKANTTAVMFSRLRAIVEEWMTQKDALVPHVFVNSSLAKAVRLAANICRINQNLSPDVREKCRRVVSFLGKTPSGNDTHWTDLVPSIDLVSNAIHDVLQNCITYDRFRGFDNQTVMFEALEQATKDGMQVYAIEFEESPKMLSMQFRFPPSMIDSTRGFNVLDKYWSPDPRYRTSNSMKYFTSGFIDLQDQVERAYVAILSQITTPKDPYANDFLPTEMQFVPGPCYQVDSMLRIFVVNIPLMVVVIWLCNYVINVRAVVYEKELHLKEFTKVMGMGNSVHWLNWFTVGFIMMGCSSVVVTILLKYGQVLPRTEGFLLFCCFIAYILAILPQAFLTTVFFNNANFGAVFSGILYIIFYIPYNLILIYDLGFVPLLVLSFLPQCTIAMTFSRLMSFEVQGIGGQWKTLWLNDLSNDSFSVGLCLLMLLVDGALAWIGIWYLENVVSGSLGFSRKWYFPFTKSYWLEVFKHSFRPKEAEGLQPQPADVDPGFHEVASKSLSVGVSVRGLTKYYGRKRVAALDNLWVDFYENQITAFLGHNGAGKTTTISILTGISAASAGTAYVYGKDINTGMPAIRHHLGLCPQHNVLFSNMSVAEHIRFYGYLKGLSRAEVDAEVGHFLVELGLKEKANDRVKTLSGGQKRQLSLAAAFVGGSKIVFLDEPTAGVDPASRRSIWNFIFRFKHSRTIILTTHHMDEADILGDRIAIVSQGHLKASGSSLFLKSKFAKNYYLNVEKAGNGGVDYTADAKLTERVAAHLPGSELAVSTPTEWIFTLPATRAYDADGFVKLFTYLEANKSTLSEEFGVNQIGLTDTSLEEIFILLSDDASNVEVSCVIFFKRNKVYILFKKEQNRC